MFEKIIIAYDSHGKELAQIIQEDLVKVNQPCEVLNCDGLDYVGATKFAVSKKGKLDGLILICGTGVGVCLLANKFRGIRAALCASSELAYFSRKHENINCLCLAGGYSDGIKEVKPDIKQIKEIVKVFLTTEFDGGRHLERVKSYNNLGERIG